MKLTVKKCESLKPILGKTVTISDGNGLYLEAMEDGKKFWRLRYTYNKKPRLKSLGNYENIDLETAREKRDEIRRAIARGIDPKLATKKTEKTAWELVQFWFETKEWGEEKTKDAVISRCTRRL